MRNRYDEFVPIIESGDIVELRNGAICVVINGQVLDLKNKIWKSTINETYDCNYLDIDGDSEFDIIKIKSCVGLRGSDYFIFQDERIRWDWIREEKCDSTFTVAKEDLKSEPYVTKEEVREIVKEELMKLLTNNCK